MALFSKSDVAKGKLVYDLKEQGPMCDKCGLYHASQNGRLAPTGKGKMRCLIIGEASGPDEDQYGKHFIGKIGKEFRGMLSNYGLDLDRDFWKVNACGCFPGYTTVGGEKVIASPSNTQIEYCRPIIQQHIRELDPQFIWLVGEAACRSVFGDKFGKVGINRWRGNCIPDREHRSWLIPIYHPSFASRNARDENITSQYKRDLNFAVSCLKKPSLKKEVWEVDEVERLVEFVDVKGVLDDFIDNPPDDLYIDIETTGLKPYRAGQKILSISLSEEDDTAFAFPLQYRDHWLSDELEEIVNLLGKILIDENIKKMAHNLKFEDEWLKIVLGIQVLGWNWDSLIAAHLLDNRRMYSGLKYQTYINFGIAPYNTDVQKYIKGFPFNRMEDVALPKLLNYNGLDTIYGMRLAYKQMDTFEEHLKLNWNQIYDAYDLFHEGTIEFSKIQQNGILANEKYYRDAKKGMKGKIKKCQNRLEHGPEAKAFEDKFSKKTGTISKEIRTRQFRVASGGSDYKPKDLADMIQHILKKELPTSKNDNPRTDKAALESLTNLPFIKDLQLWRQLNKLDSTYLNQFLRAIHEDRMHPSFDLIVPVSYRSSASDPSFQNIPVREEEAKRVCRSGIIPNRGWHLLDADYKSIEVSIGCCYHQDENMITYLTDDSTDMHRDTTLDIWQLPLEEVTDNLRFHSKNGWVFPEFYGSYYKNCAVDLWGRCLHMKTASGILIKDWIDDKGITTYRKFEDHCKEVERIFWKERFSGYDQWKTDINRFYIKHGYIETLFGFRFRGYMTSKEVGNYPIQGTAFHVMLWTLIQINRELRKRKMRSMIIGQVHDSILFNTPPNEKDELISMLLDIGTKQVRDKFEWITIPLKIDLELSPINHSWYDKQKLKG